MDDVPNPTPRELQILKVLWELGPSGVRDVHRQFLKQGEDVHFNTLQTMLRVMAGKDLVTFERRGRAFIYQAGFSRDESTARFLDHVYDGAVSELVLSLLRNENVSSSELRQMQAMIDAARCRQRGSVEEDAV